MQCVLCHVFWHTHLQHARDDNASGCTGNTISNGRGNGCIGRANNGLIENNIITNMAYNGVEVGPSLQAREGSFCSNVMVI